MILLLDTSTRICKLTLVEGDWRREHEWQADRSLASDLLKYLDGIFHEHGKIWRDITAIGVFVGPGSFTGLRIGLAVMNTFANALKLPIVGGKGDNWQDQILAKLKDNKDEKIVLPFYGSEANITLPKK